MRSFLTRFPNSLTGVVLLAPCLLSCLACATPFPLEKLREGMTAEDVRDQFGTPEAIDAGSGDAGSCSCYLAGEQIWLQALWLPLRIPLTLASLPFAAVFPELDWDHLFRGGGEVVLHFEQEKLVRWEKTGLSGYTMDRPGWGMAGDSGPPQSFITVSPPPCRWPQTRTEEGFQAGDTCYVHPNYVSFWLEPTASSEKRILDRGRRMRILGRRCNWCHVEDAFGRQGWVSCVFLNASKP